MATTSAAQQDHDSISTPTKKILVLGSCGLDRLLAVPSYPEADSKIRTTSYHEIGGGNAANSATAMGRILTAKAFTGTNGTIQVQLATIVGDDAAGDTLVKGLTSSGVDLSSPLFNQKPDSTTGVTVIIVSESEHTRTCLHTPGTCGEWTVNDLERMSMDDLFEQVIHFHSDARHTDVALQMAKEARKRGIPVSLDVEKDRNTKSLDELLQYTTHIFTNSLQIETYLNKLNHENEATFQRQPLSNPEIVDHSNGPLSKKEQEFFAHVLKPSMYLTRWFPQVQKQVIVTKGEMGSVHVLCESFESLSHEHEEGTRNQLVFMRVENDDSDDFLLRVNHQYVEQSTSGNLEIKKISATYLIQTRGVIEHVAIVDTTGSGDALIGGYLAALCGMSPSSTIETTASQCLAFGTWVAGCKLQGPGAQATLPTAAMVNDKLGEDAASVRASISHLLTPFRLLNDDEQPP